jgi:molybdate transport system substrate-binding protein
LEKVVSKQAKKIALWAFGLMMIPLVLPSNLHADKTGMIVVAVAANFIKPMGEIVNLFTEETNIMVDTSYSSTGALFAQINNGAPFDNFVAADEQRPRLLNEKGICQQPFIYAIGRVVLWTKRTEFEDVKDWKQIISRPDVHTIALANPSVAPYGEKAARALRVAELWQHVEKKLVYSQSVGQAFHYGHQGATDLAFVSLSDALYDKGAGAYWQIPEASDITQSACVLGKTENRAGVRLFIEFMQSERAKDIRFANGYQ